MLWLTATTRKVNHDPIQEMCEELSRRRMAYHIIPTKGLVFDSIGSKPASSENLTLSLDMPINQALIEYEAWLVDAMSTLRASVWKLTSHQSRMKNNMIKEITIATEEVSAAKRDEWSRQLVEMHAEVPLPQFPVGDQSVTVDGGKSHPVINLMIEVLNYHSREIPIWSATTIGPYYPVLLPGSGNLLSCHEHLHRTLRIPGHDLQGYT
jgi:hypothetical protein